MDIQREDTLVGPSISAVPDDTLHNAFALTINRGGIFLTDGHGEIPIEIGESGMEGNKDWTDDVSSITDREVKLIYEIALYQYSAFQDAEEEEEESCS